MKEAVISFLEQEGTKILYLLLILSLLTFLQKYHYAMINYLKNSYGSIIKFLFSFIQRLTVIVHEFSHIMFAFIFGAQIKNIDLWDKKGGKVNFSMKDYIGSIGSLNRTNKLIFTIQLILNRIGIFLTSIGPLLVGIGINLLLYLRILEIDPENITSVSDFTQNLTRIKTVAILIYAIVVIPSFILSYQDIRNLIFYKGYNIFATMIGSFINILILCGFLYGLTFIFFFFELFFFSYLFSFVITLLIFILTKSINKYLLQKRKGL